MDLGARKLTLSAAVVGVVFTLSVSLFSVVHLAYRSVRVHVALETAEALIGFLTAYLIFGRFRETRRSTSFLLVLGLLFLAGTSVFFSVIPRAANPQEAAFSTWAALAGRMTGTILLASAAFVPDVPVRRRAGSGLVLIVTWAVFLAIIWLAMMAFQDRLPLGIDPRLSPESAERPRVVGHAAILAMQLILVGLYSAAAVRFTTRAEQSGDVLMRWLGAACMLAAFSRFNYFLFPSIYTQYVYAGDVLRLGFYLCLLYGSTREIRTYWRRLEEALAEHEQLDAMKNTLLSAVSHDLRNPLSAILGMSATLEEHGTRLAPEEVREMQGRVTSGARKLDRMLGELLDLQRIEAGVILQPERRRTDMGALITRVVGDLEEATARPVDIEADGVVGLVDEAKVERIVENLLRNAIKHTGREAQVWVRASRQDRGTLIAVEDSGAGVDEEMRQRIFAPFERGIRPGAAGAGIGLSLVARFSELHGGRAWVEGRPGGGASFRVFLPDG